MTVPKNQSTAAKKARAVQAAAGGKHTTLLAEQVCAIAPDPWAIEKETCARAPHPHSEPCSTDRAFDVAAWQARMDAEQAAEDARRAALTPEQRAAEDMQAREWEDQEMRAEQASEHVDDEYYGDVN